MKLIVPLLCASLQQFATAAVECPGSAAVSHAKAQVGAPVLPTTVFIRATGLFHRHYAVPALPNQVTSTFANACTDVLAELKARVAGEDGWVDPHNAGNYTILSEEASTLHLSHATGNGKYTDLLNVELTDTEEGGCELSGCSESQVSSIKDFSTNFCKRLPTQRCSWSAVLPSI